MDIVQGEDTSLRFLKHSERLKDKMFSKKRLKPQLPGHTIDIRNSNNDCIKFDIIILIFHQLVVLKPITPLVLLATSLLDQLSLTQPIYLHLFVVFPFDNQLPPLRIEYIYHYIWIRHYLSFNLHFQD